MKFFAGLLALVLLVAGVVAWLVYGSGDDAGQEAVDAVDSPYWNSQTDQRIDIDGVLARVRVEGPQDAPVMVCLLYTSPSPRDS